MGPIKLFVALALVALNISPADAMRTGAQLRANPIRRVVNMLHMMQKKVAAEGVREEALFKEFMCYCDGGGGKLKGAIADAEKRLPLLHSSVEDGEAEQERLTLDLKEAKKNLGEATQALEDGKALRLKEAAAFAKESASYKTNIESLARARVALKKGAGAGFLQTRAADVVRRLAVDFEDLSGNDRDTLSVFLAMTSSQAQKYEPQSGEIIGIVTQMQDNMETELVAMTKKEDVSSTTFAEMERAKNSEITSLRKAIESKTARRGELEVELTEERMELEDTSEALASDKAFLADLDKNCVTKKAEWEVRQKMRAEELLALADTIKILSGDESLDLFKKTLPSPTTTMSFMQIQVPERQLRGDALQALRGGGRDPRLKLLAMQLKGAKHAGFGKVLEMIDGMLKLCGKEQDADDEKNSQCSSELGKAGDEKKGLEEDVADLDKVLDDLKSKAASTDEDIETLRAGIKHLDEMVAEATKQRKTEHADFEASRADDSAAKDLLAIAKNRLRKFYSPALYKDAQDQPSVPVTLVQARMVSKRGDPGAAPETFGKYEKMGGEDTGVMAMLDMLINDMEKDMKEKAREEQEAQSDYEETLKDAASKRREDFETLERARGNKADHEARIHKETKRHKSKSEELASVEERLRILHDSCDWLLANFEARKEARATEVEALQKSRSVLSGADSSL